MPNGITIPIVIVYLSVLFRMMLGVNSLCHQRSVVWRRTSPRFAIINRPVRGASRLFSTKESTTISNLHEKEVLFVPPAWGNDQNRRAAIDQLLKMRPQLHLMQEVHSTGRELRWAAYRNNVNIDSTFLEEHFLGKDRVNEQETARFWDAKIAQRVAPMHPTDCTAAPCMDGGKYQREIDMALKIVSRLSYTSRSVQQLSFYDAKQSANADPSTSLSIDSDQFAKVDTTPVTIVDYGVQAVVLRFLHECFPDDTFIAEEDSSYLRKSPALTEKVLDFVQASTGGARWTTTELYTAIDLGSSDEHKQHRSRAWVLDPIDGTKGFIRGEHFCIALALLDYGQRNATCSHEGRRPILSVLGCPQLSLDRVLAATSSSDKCHLSDVVPPSYTRLSSMNQTEIHQLFQKDVGSVFFAVKDQGAYVKSLDMPVGLGYPCSVSTVSNPSEISLCESREALMSTSRAITGRVRGRLGMMKEFVRLDGQCKHGLVGAGSVEGSLRLPPPGYIEKIWDQAPGLFFIEEAGGKVTDLKGREIDFSAGSEPAPTGQCSLSTAHRKAKDLSPVVKGVIVSNGHVHASLVEAVQLARNELKDMDELIMRWRE